MKRTLLIAAGIVGILVGAGLIMPAVAWWRQNGPDGRAVVIPLAFGTALVLSALFTLVTGARRTQA
jgi:hypothetical protein